MKDAEIALQQNDSNKLISALENAILTGLRIATNNNSLTTSSSELLNLLKTKMQDDVLTHQLKGILEKCQNARYGWGLSIDELNSLIPDVKNALDNLIIHS
jgi:parvulin-like peptidyl-prolyl isomerase